MKAFILILTGFAFACSDATPPPESRLDPAISVAGDSQPESPERFDEIMKLAEQEKLHELPFGQIMQRVGEQFHGLPYVAGQLDAPKNEVLVASFESFDCVLYIEVVLALSRNIALQDTSYDTFLKHLEDQRYRDGELNGYCSRLHYFSEWISNNEERGNVANITRALGGALLPKTLDFMSNHRDAYAQLVSDTLFAGIQEMETRLRGLEIYYIPQNQINAVYNRLEAGDLVAAATDIAGLDVAHTGMVYAFPNGKIGFQHASVSDGVTVAPDLQKYIQGVRRQIGIVVIRPVDPRTATE